MKTIKQMADELGIDKQRVYRFIKKNHIKEAHQKNGVNQYDETAENLIIGHFSKNDRINEAHQNRVKNDTVEALVEMLRQELEIKNKQIDELHDRLSEVTTALTEAQKSLQSAQALHAGTIQTQLLEGDSGSDSESSEPAPVPQKKSLWKKVFRK